MGFRDARPLVCAAAAAAMMVSLLSAPTAASGAASVSVEVLSGRADSVSGGDALVSVSGAPAGSRVVAAGVDVTEAFAPRGDSLVGLVDGLPIGTSEIVVTSKNGKEAASVEVVNHPITGPVFSGPQHPMYCTASGAPWNLGPVDEDCHVAAAVVSYRYRTTTGQFAAYPTDGSTPANVATTTTSDGATVPYIVRIERGTINRAVYETAMLMRPALPSPHRGSPLPAGTGSSPPSAARAASATGRARARGRGERSAAVAWLRRRLCHVQRLRPELQRRHQRRDRDDGQGACGRAARSGGIHDRLRRLRRHDASTAAREQLPGHPQRRAG